MLLDQQKHGGRNIRVSREQEGISLEGRSLGARGKGKLGENRK